MAEIRNVAIIGAGTMGHSLAQVFAQGGYPVCLHDVRDEILEKAKRLMASNMKTMEEMGLLKKGEPAAALGRVQTTTRLEEAGKNADFVIEAIVEEAEPKKKLFAELDRVCPPHAILASNTSFMDIFKFVETRRPEKVLITHWFAPPHIVPLVEIVRGPQTSAAVVDTTKALMTRLGKKPIVITKFLQGFIANRLQAALRNETLFLLDNGYASAEDIDEAAKASFALRMPIVGLVKRMDFAGLDLSQRVLANRLYDPPPAPTSSPTLDRLISQGKLGVKTGSGFYEYKGSTEEILRERDLKLIKLMQFLKEMGEL
jgi:3-hydroxybutyryl-CoA dehydrogenase